MPEDHILYSALKTLDVPGSMDSTNSALVKLPGGAKNLIIGGMNDNTVLGGVRATEAAGFKAANVIGIGINGTDAIGELKKPDSGFFGSMRSTGFNAEPGSWYTIDQGERGVHLRNGAVIGAFPVAGGRVKVPRAPADIALGVRDAERIGDAGEALAAHLDADGRVVKQKIGPFEPGEIDAWAH